MARQFSGTKRAALQRRVGTSNNHQPYKEITVGLIWSIIAWAVFGLIVGAIARMLYPGSQPMSLLATMVLGIIGSLLGGFIGWAFGFSPEEGPFRGAGWIMSIVGALIVVWIGLYASSRRRTT
jgi:uncharacterized membrane protein YeaQ/YmgE (transglycosylase-associated protein family)